MKGLALYLSSRRKTVKSTSRAGRMNANVLARRDLKYREHGNDRSKSHCGKTEKAEHRHEQQRHSHAEEFHHPSGEENLEQERERVNRQIELSEKRSARSAIGETGLGQFGLLKIRPGRCERVEQNK